MPAVDVVVPCYNYAHYLETCVASVLSQRDVDVRILIIDDCSPDNTPEVATRLAAADPRVTYRRNEKNLRLIGVSNLGVIEWASAPYTLLLSADDLLVPGSLARATEVLEKHPEAGMAYGMAITIGNEGLAPPADGAPEYRLLSGSQFVRFCCENGNPAPSPSVLVRTATQKLVGPYNSVLPHTSDLEMWMRFAMRGPVIALNNVQAFYRMHGGNAYSEVLAGMIGDKPALLQTFEAALASPESASIPEMGAWVDAMRARFADEAYWHAGEAYAKGYMKSYPVYAKYAAEWSPRYRNKSVPLRHQLKRLVGSNFMRRLRGEADFTETPQAEVMPPGSLMGKWPSSAYAEAA